ncbi:unnamed protein product [Moneuplotes crassus]|uniref:Uncharacterized protein n=1 Tax=Euplotes crassus TaxID=5936 RepID=A0AAD1X3Y5_EUPCR|nr:unnamed protein product [Moneuplotes crassus]
MKDLNEPHFEDEKNNSISQFNKGMSYVGQEFCSPQKTAKAGDKAKRENSTGESETEEVSLKFFLQQLLDIGDLFGTLIIFMIMRGIDLSKNVGTTSFMGSFSHFQQPCAHCASMAFFYKSTFSDYSDEHDKLFVIEVISEIICELIWTVSIIPLIKMFTMFKNFCPSAAALPVLRKELAYFALVSTLAYPLMLFLKL